jgi:hypothetical protein
MRTSDCGGCGYYPTTVAVVETTSGPDANLHVPWPFPLFLDRPQAHDLFTTAFTLSSPADVTINASNEDLMSGISRSGTLLPLFGREPGRDSASPEGEGDL